MSKITIAFVLLLCGALAPTVKAAEPYIPGQKVKKTFAGFAQPFLGTGLGQRATLPLDLPGVA